jgi:hypothetical protein
MSCGTNPTQRTQHSGLADADTIRDITTRAPSVNCGCDQRVVPPLPAQFCITQRFTVAPTELARLDLHQ